MVAVIDYGPMDSEDSTSNSVILDLQQNDLVWLQLYEHREVYSSHYRFTTFSGFLLFPNWFKNKLACIGTCFLIVQPKLRGYMGGAWRVESPAGSKGCMVRWRSQWALWKKVMNILCSKLNNTDMQMLNVINNVLFLWLKSGPYNVRLPKDAVSQKKAVRRSNVSFRFARKKCSKLILGLSQNRTRQ